MDSSQVDAPSAQNRTSLEQVQAPETSGHTGARRILVWTPVFLALLALFGLLGWGLLRQQTGASGFSINEGPAAVAALNRPAGDFNLELYEPFEGRAAFRLSDYRGRVVVLNFWASWCPPCRQEAPDLEQAWRDYRDQGVIFVGVNIWDTETGARAYLDEFDITYPNAIDEGGRVAVEYGITGIPETYFITSDGQVSRKVIGALTRPILDQSITEAKQAAERAP